jgi:hypothetical protein
MSRRAFGKAQDGGFGPPGDNGGGATGIEALASSTIFLA